MGDKLEVKLEKGEVRQLPPHKHSPVPVFVARTDDVSGTGEELLLLTPGKEGIKVLPYGDGFTFWDYVDLPAGGFVPVIELSDGTFTYVDETGPETPEEEDPET